MCRGIFLLKKHPYFIINTDTLDYVIRFSDIIKTRHEDFDGKFSLNVVIRSIDQKLTRRLKCIDRPFRSAYLRTMIRLNSKPFCT